MSDLRKAAEAVLEAWDWDWSEPRNEALRERMGALRQALAQPEQEPVAWGMRRKDGVILDIKNADFEHEGYEKIYTVPLYTAPPKRECVGITKEDKKEILEMTQPDTEDIKPWYTIDELNAWADKHDNIQTRGDK